MKVAVIGAGMAGLTAASILQSAGARVTVFDKSKGTGGRLASRYHDQGWIDHGAPYFAAERPFLIDFLQEQLPAEYLTFWQPPASGRLQADERLQAVGVPRNSAITRGLLTGQNFYPSTRISRLSACADGWQLFNDDGALLGIWPQLVVAVPAPQALALLQEQKQLAEQIGTARMEPCWVVAIRTDKPLRQLAEVSVYQHPVIRRIVHNSGKPNRQNANIYLVQATKSWSRQHLEEAVETIGPVLQRHFNNLVAADVTSELLFAHRWRFAFTETALGKPFLWDEHLHLGVCGDWCLGRQVEDAWQSGADLAVRMLSTSAEEIF
jgi:predicted NAD/FAD-dependent oxidoreductase